MKPRITLLTLGVDDLERALAFYRDGLGFPTRGIVGTEFEHGAVAFFELQPGLQLAIWPRADIASVGGGVEPADEHRGLDPAGSKSPPHPEGAKRPRDLLTRGSTAPAQPPAIAPTTKRGSAPLATGSGSGASGGSWDRSCPHAKNLTNGRRRCVTWARIVPRSTG